MHKLEPNFRSRQSRCGGGHAFSEEEIGQGVQETHLVKGAAASSKMVNERTNETVAAAVACIQNQSTRRVSQSVGWSVGWLVGLEGKVTMGTHGSSYAPQVAWSPQRTRVRRNKRKQASRSNFIYRIAMRIPMSLQTPTVTIFCNLDGE